MNLGRSWLLASAAVAVIAWGVATGVTAQSPSASPDVSPIAGSPAPSLVASPVPSATPFPWPTLPRERLARGTFPDWPSGPPTASVTDRGIRLDLWLSSTDAAPGDWVQAIVRATNVGRDTAWVKTGSQCLRHTLTEVDIDLTRTIPRGVDQTGPAADFKARLLERGFHDHFRSPRYAFGRDEAMVDVRAWAECTFIEPRLFAEPLAPGGTRTERFYWQAGRPDTYAARGRLVPLFPGTVPVTATWAFAGRGPSPSQDQLGRWIKPMRVTSSMSLTGDGPGTPSYPELVDAALADPRFGAWVESNPFQKGWVIWSHDLRPEAYNAYLRRDQYLDTDNAPNGALELFVGQSTRTDSASLHPKAGIYVDPWTGAVIDRWP